MREALARLDYDVTCMSPRASAADVQALFPADIVIADVESGEGALWYALGAAHARRQPPSQTTPPLEGIVAAEAIDAQIRSYLEQNGIVAARDLARLSLDGLAASGVTRPALTRFVRELARSGRYPDDEALQQFLIRRGIFI